MDIASALADLSEISSQIETAVVFDAAGTVLGSTGTDETRSNRLARAALDLVAAAEHVRPGEGRGRALTQIEGSLREGSVFVVTGAERAIAATTTPEPTSGLVFYDLKTCLRSLVSEQTPSKPPEPTKPRRKSKKQDEADA